MKCSHCKKETLNGGRMINRHNYMDNTDYTIGVLCEECYSDGDIFDEFTQNIEEQILRAGSHN